MDPLAAPERYRLADLVVDVGDASVRRGGERIPLPPRTFELLVVLLRHHPSLVRRASLLDSVWRDEHVTDQTLSHRVMVLRKALGDHAEHPAYVAGERGFGYRLVAPVERLAGGVPPAVDGGAGRRPRHRLAATVAGLLPVALIGGAFLGRDPPPGAPPRAVTLSVRPAPSGEDPGLAPLAEEFAGAIATGLRRVRGVRVLRWSAAARPDLWVETACDGSGARPRVRVHVVDARRASVLWSAAYEGAVYDILDREPVIAAAVARAVQERVVPGAPVPPGEPRIPKRAARQCLRGEALWFCWTRESLRRSAEAWEAAMGAAPDVAHAAAGAALTEAVASLLGYVPPSEAEPRVRAHVNRAVVLDVGLPATRLASGLARLLFDRDVPGAAAVVREAAADDEEDARGPLVLAVLALAEGRFAEAARLTGPLAREGAEASAAGLLHARACLALGEPAAAEAAFARVLAESPDLPAARVGRAESLARLGRLAAAVAVLEGRAPSGPAGPALRRAWRRLCTSTSPALPAPERLRACIGAGDLPAAQAELRRGVDEAWPHVVLASRDPAYAALVPSAPARPRVAAR